MSKVDDYGKPALDPPRVKLVQGEAVSLGCGTLILIAIIVSMFSGGKDVKREVRELRAEVTAVKKLLETQTKQLQSLEEKIDKTHPQ